MATHGFISVKFVNEPIENRTLIHAVHDGYIENMMDDIITLPFYIALTFKRK